MKIDNYYILSLITILSAIFSSRKIIHYAAIPDISFYYRGHINYDFHLLLLR